MPGSTAALPLTRRRWSRALTRPVGAAVGVVGLVLGFVSSASAVASQPTPCVQPDDRVAAIAISGDVAYLGGRFTRVRDRSGTFRPRAHLAAVDTASCDLLPWSVATDGDVTALAVSGGTVYAGGSFTTIGGAGRARIAAVDASTAAVQSWNPGANASVNTLAVGHGLLYAGGAFTTVAGQSRSRLAAFDLTSGDLDSTWRPSASGPVLTVAAPAASDRAYVGGSFKSLNGDASAAFIGAVASHDGDLDRAFGARLDFPVIALTADTAGVYAGGGGSGGHLIIWNLDGSLQRPIYQMDGGVQAVALRGRSLFAGGHFTNYCLGNTGSGRPFVCDRPLSRRKIVEVSLDTGDLTSWAPAFDSPHGVLAEAVDSSGALWTGGDFTKVDGRPVAHLAVFR